MRPMLAAVRQGRLTLTAVTSVIFSLPFRTVVSVGLPFRTSGTKNSNFKGGRYPYKSLYRDIINIACSGRLLHLQ